MNGLSLRTIAIASIFMGILLFATLVLLEVIARIFDPLGVSYYPDNARFMDTMIIEEPIGYRNRPNLDDEFFGHRVTLNSLGLRGPEYQPRAADDLEIMFLGDSVVFGVGVDNENTIPALLEERLASHSSFAIDNSVKVINMGGISYNTEQELIQYKQIGQNFSPDLILLMFSSNDIEPKMWIFNRRENPVVKYAQKSYAISLLFIIKRRLGVLFSKPGSDNYIQWSAYSKENPRWQSIERSLIELNNFAKSKEIPFILLGQGKANRSWNMVAEVAKKEGFPAHLINPFADKRWQELDPDSFYAKKGGGHLNGQGLRMYSQLIEELLVNGGYVDQYK